MDIQGSQYHLLHGVVDWGGCTDSANGLSLAELWRDAEGGVPSSVPTSWEYDAAQDALRLRRDTPLFRRAGRTEPLVPDSRRGAGRDGYGHWYWIDSGRRGIRRLPDGARTAEDWWSVDDLVGACTDPSAASGGEFADVTGPAPSGMTLSGLTVTRHHYLLAGYTCPTENGLLVFDLQGGGTPLRLLWPAGFGPWDLCDTDDGGALVLDREHAAYWRLDEHLRVRGTRPSHPTGFVAADGSGPVLLADRVVPAPFALRDAAGRDVHPISIEPGPGESVLVLDAETTRGYSVLYCFDDDVLRWQTSMADVVEVIDPEDPTNTSFRYSLTGHDFCYQPQGQPLEGPRAGEPGDTATPLVYVADAEGDQVVAFRLDPDTGVLVARDEFLPMRRWAERALVRAGVDLWYDFGERWISVQVFTECRFASTATLTTAAEFVLGDPVGQSLDSGLPACVWHRLLLDAHVPTGTAVAVRARAADDPTLLELEDWVPQPTPYQRGDGSELPWSDPWADRRTAAGLPDGTGTHELLFQQVVGRYLQLELTISGGGRSSVLLRSLRAWFPRFSYPEHYLPAVYAEHDGPDRFLERFLANMEGSYTALEEKIEHSHLILDARTARAADLGWLAAWFGLALDPLWDEARSRFLIRHVDRFYRTRGTIAGLVALLRVYLDDAVDEGIFRGSGAGAGGVRVVERFLTRDSGGALYGAPASTPDPDLATRVAGAAHRFDVLVPVGLSEDQTAMVTRIIENARPGHTSFQVRRYYELFVVGQARLGMDTELGRGPAFEPFVTASTALAGGYLGYPHPYDLTDRIVADRDRINSLPAL
jgi:phage tail-like protein